MVRLFRDGEYLNVVMLMMDVWWQMIDERRGVVRGVRVMVECVEKLVWIGVMYLYFIFYLFFDVDFVKVWWFGIILFCVSICCWCCCKLVVNFSYQYGEENFCFGVSVFVLCLVWYVV